MNYTTAYPNGRLVRDLIQTINGILDGDARAATYPESTGRPSGSTWTPRVDLHEDPKFYSLRMDIPGVSRETIDISYLEGVLTVSGERKDEVPGEGVSRIASNTPRGKFHTEVRIGDMVNPSSISADYKDGVLAVSVPKSEAAKPVKISVS